MESSAFTRVSEILSERVSELSPFALLLALFAASAIYYFSKQYFQYRVSSERAVLFTAPFAESQQSDVAIGARHGCQPPPELPSRWPLGIDRIRELWASNSEGRLLAFLCSVAKDYEPRNNLSQYLLFGPRAFHTLHPKNVEAVLSTNFKGSHSFIYKFLRFPANGTD